MRICTIPNCGRKHYGKGYCGKHYQKFREFGDPLHGKEYGAGHEDKDGYMCLPTHDRKLVHIDICEKVLKRKLPTGAVVHHVDGNRKNNSNNNLVICQDRAYHNLIHKRERALNECGNADFLKCTICGEYDDPKNFPKYKNRHKTCHTTYESNRKLRAIK